MSRRGQLIEAAGLARSEAPAVRFLATDGAERFARVGSRFLERSVSPADVEVIELSGHYSGRL